MKQVSKEQKVRVWLIWLVAVLVTLVTPDPFGVWPAGTIEGGRSVGEGVGVVINMEIPRQLFPWLPNYRYRKRALAAYRRWRRAYRRARYRFWVAYTLAKLARRGALSLAWVVDRLTQSQLQRQLGALPVLYQVLETLQVEAIINQYCASRCEVSHGTVGLVLILNRLQRAAGGVAGVRLAGSDGAGVCAGRRPGQVQEGSPGARSGRHSPPL